MASENDTTGKDQMPGTPKITAKPNVYRVEDDTNLKEEDLERTYLFGDAKMKNNNDPGMEGRGMGGENFGGNNITPAGNDKNNPPQNAGEDNAYFSRTQPAEEHPEDENFVPEEQEGESGKKGDRPNVPGLQELAGRQKVGEQIMNGGRHRPNPQQDYQEGTADDDGKKP